MEEFIYHLFEAVHQVRYKVSVLFHIIFIVGPLKLACSPPPPPPFLKFCNWLNPRTLPALLKVVVPYYHLFHPLLRHFRQFPHPHSDNPCLDLIIHQASLHLNTGSFLGNLE